MTNAVYPHEVDRKLALALGEEPPNMAEFGINSDQMEAPYTFEDIEKYTYCHLDGEPGWILDKGEHIVNSMDPSSHIVIQLVPESDDEPATEKRLHERIVNKYLVERDRLWIDWGDKLAPAGNN